jgi:biotin synthase
MALVDSPAAVPPAADPPAWLGELSDKALARVCPTRAEALAVLATPASGDRLSERPGPAERLAPAELLDVVAAASRPRRAFFGRRVKLNYLVNMKSGLCGEDCSYCSQRRGSQAGVLTYNWLSPETAAAEATRAAASGAARVCLVASGRGPSERDIDRVAGTIAAVRRQAPPVEICVCLGLLGPGQAERLKEAGADAYNHNLNTAPSHYANVCTTHTFEDRAETVLRAAAAGLSPCSGVIVGVGETDDQLVELAVNLRALSPRSVPVNFLMPFPGTPLAGRAELTPERCLRVLAMFRFFFPDVELRIAGGREMHLRSLQPLGLHVANSIFLGDYLTSEGAPGRADLEMIADAGFVLEGAGEHPGGPWPAPAPVPSLRRRGPGTGLPANA